MTHSLRFASIAERISPASSISLRVPYFRRWLDRQLAALTQS